MRAGERPVTLGAIGHDRQLRQLEKNASNGIMFVCRHVPVTRQQP